MRVVKLWGLKHALVSGSLSQPKRSAFLADLSMAVKVLACRPAAIVQAATEQTEWRADGCRECAGPIGHPSVQLLEAMARTAVGAAVPAGNIPICLLPVSFGIAWCPVTRTCANPPA